MILDTHVHVVSGDRDRYPVTDSPPAWPVTTGETLAADMDRLGVERAMLVQSFFTYRFDNSYALACARARPERFQVVAVIDQVAPDAADILEALVKDHDVRGLRLMPKGMPEGVLWDERSVPVWQKAGELGIPVTIAAEIQHHGERLSAMVARFPQVRVGFEHMWEIEIDRPPFTALAPVVALARYPNVFMKLAPNNSFAAREAGVRPRDLYDHLLQAFGIERLMWGSNYPAHPAKFGSYEDRLRIMQDDLSYLSAEQAAAFFGGNAARLWPSDAPIPA